MDSPAPTPPERSWIIFLPRKPEKSRNFVSRTLKIPRNLGKLRFHGSADTWERRNFGIKLPKKSTKTIKFTSEQGIPVVEVIPRFPRLPKFRSPQGEEAEIPKIHVFSSERSRKTSQEKLRIPKSLWKIRPAPLWRLFLGRESREHSNNFGINGKNEFPELPRPQPPRDPCGYLGIFPTKSRPKPSEFQIIPENLA